MKYSISALNQRFTKEVNFLCKLYGKTVKFPRKAFRQKLNSLRRFLPKVASLSMERDYLPFLIVVTDKLVSLKARGEQMVVDWSGAHISGGVDSSRNLVRVPKRICYLAVNVEDGTRTACKFSRTDRDSVGTEVPERSPLNLDEGIALVMKLGCPNLGWKHSLVLAGSHCTNGHNPNEIAVMYRGSDEYEDFVHINQTYCNRQPSYDTENSLWGTPTCEMRLG